ncbi:MAG: DUF3991 and TOPRIM domain-containing protein [Eubacterium sp.]|nr:DUF3991 and TOPRIM domain-containing protein [Eubacterium sp.]
MGVYIPPEDVEEARRISLLDYLRQNRPDMYGNIRRVGSQYIVLARYFGTKGMYSSFSIKASTGDWWWHSKGLHGKNALDYLMKVDGYHFQQAVFEVLGTCEADYEKGTHAMKRLIREDERDKAPVVQPIETSYENANPKQLVIPEADKDTGIIRQYLAQRGIDPEVTDFFIKEGSIYQDAWHKSVCFVGYDREGNPRIVNQRGTTGTFKGNTKGSDRRYSFMLCAGGERSVHFFEAPIDTLSYACLLKHNGYDFRKFNLVSLSGISGTGYGAELHLPSGVEEYLDRFPETNVVYIHFDNDKPGRTAGQRLEATLAQKGILAVQQYPPEGCKDVNDYLVALREREAGKAAEIVTGKAAKKVIEAEL